LIAIVDGQESVKDETGFLPDTQKDDGDFQDQTREIMSRALQGTLPSIPNLTKTNGCRRSIYSQNCFQAESEEVTSSGA
jgi:hypothetical protein